MGLWARWFGKRQPTSSPVMVQQEDYATPMPPGTGWRMWTSMDRGSFPYDLPYVHDKVEMWHPAWEGGKVIIAKPSGMHPATNVHGLWWRPVP